MIGPETGNGQRGQAGGRGSADSQGPEKCMIQVDVKALSNATMTAPSGPLQCVERKLNFNKSITSMKVFHSTSNDHPLVQVLFSLFL